MISTTEELEKLDTLEGHKFSEEIAKELIIDSEIVYEEDLEYKRWTRVTLVVLKFNNKLFETVYQQGLTEYQEDDYYGVEFTEVVEKNGYEITYVKKYTPINNEKTTKTSITSKDIDSLKLVSTDKSLLEIKKALNIIEKTDFKEMRKKIKALQSINPIVGNHSIILAEYIDILENIKKTL